MHQLVDAIQMSTQDIGLYDKKKKKKSFTDLFYSLPSVGSTLPQVFPEILKNLSAHRGN